MRDLSPQRFESAAVPVVTARGRVMLALTTIGFALNFWAWALISSLSPPSRGEGTPGRLSESDVAPTRLGSHRPHRGWERVGS